MKFCSLQNQSVSLNFPNIRILKKGGQTLSIFPDSSTSKCQATKVLPLNLTICCLHLIWQNSLRKEQKDCSFLSTMWWIMVRFVKGNGIYCTLVLMSIKITFFLLYHFTMLICDPYFLDSFTYHSHFGNDCLISSLFVFSTRGADPGFWVTRWG